MLSFAGRIALVAAGIAITIFGVFSISSAYKAGTPEEIGVTDFRRDLIAASLVDRGQNPYQRIVDLTEFKLPERSRVGAPDGTWIAHSPLSIAMARLMESSMGIDGAEKVAGIIQLLAIAAISLIVVINVQNRFALLAVGLVLLSKGTIAEVFWIQGSSLVALALFLIYGLVANHRNLALVFLGLLVAWRPWLAPLVLFLPGGEKPARDSILAGSVGIGATLLASPLIGGLASIQRWRDMALPANLDYFLGYAWNQSVTAPYLLVSIVYLLYAGAILTGFRLRGRVPEFMWPVLGAAIILSFSPLVWSQYWLALVPALLPLIRIRSEIFVLLFFAMSWPLTQTPFMARTASYLAFSILIVFLVISAIDTSFEHTPGRLNRSATPEGALGKLSYEVGHAREPASQRASAYEST